jgi:outer membrane protein OmpA-like peptidoglycan-associated protein
MIIEGKFQMFQLMDLAPCFSALLNYALSLVATPSKTRRAEMSNYLGSLKRNMVSTAVAAGLALTLLGLGFAQAGEQPTTDQIIHSLTPKPMTRSLTISPAQAAQAAEEKRFLDELRNRERTRSLSLSLGEREQVAVIAKDKPKIDLELNFEFNSDRISKSAMPTVEALAKALNNAVLKGKPIMVAGYTDAKGSDEYNQGLSERRAAAVKQILVEKYGVSADNLMTVGYGKTHLKNATDPYAAENRRAAIVNLASDAAGQ